MKRHCRVDTDLVDELVMEVWHFQFDEAPRGLLDVSAA